MKFLKKENNETWRPKGLLWQHLEVSEGEGEDRKDNKYLELVVQSMVVVGYVPPQHSQNYFQGHGDGVSAYTGQKI